MTSKDSGHKLAVKNAVDKLEEIVESLEVELRRREADLKVMRLMYAQCDKEEKEDDGVPHM